MISSSYNNANPINLDSSLPSTVHNTGNSSSLFGGAGESPLGQNDAINRSGNTSSGISSRQIDQVIELLIKQIKAMLDNMLDQGGGNGAGDNGAGGGNGMQPDSNGTGSHQHSPFSQKEYSPPPVNGSGQTPSGDGTGNGSGYGTGSGSSGGTGSGSGTGGSGSGTGSVTSGGNKQGLGVSPTSANGNGSDLASKNASWYYDWSPTPTATNDPSAQFVPMIHDQSQMTSQDLQAAKTSSSPMLLTFNEPEQAGQANMSVDQAISDWPQLEATGKQLSSPAVSNDATGQQWLDQFMQQAQDKGLKVSSIALHWYGDSSKSDAQNLSDLKSYIDGVHEKYPNMPIDLTEFGLDPNGNSAKEDPAFLSQAEQMLNGMSYVQMYAPYGLGGS